MKTQQLSVRSRGSGDFGGFVRRVLLGSCAAAWVLSCESAPKAEPKAEVSVAKEEAQQPPSTPAAAEHPTAAETQPATDKAAAPDESQPAAEPALNAPASATTASLTAKPQTGSTPAVPSADPPSNAALKKGAAVSEEPFSAWLEASSPLPVGTASSVDVVLVAKAPYHTNAEYPHKFKLAAAPAGLSYPESIVKGMQVNADRSVLHVPIRAQQPGPATVTGTLSFSVCTEERCLVEKRELSLALEAK